MEHKFGIFNTVAELKRAATAQKAEGLNMVDDLKKRRDYSLLGLVHIVPYFGKSG